MRFTKRLFFSAFLLTATLMSFTGAHAQETETKRVAADYLQARLLSAVTAHSGTKPFTAGLEIRLDEDWHAYWRTPGDGGLPPQLDWSASENVATLTMDYPAPIRFDTAGLISFGYENTILFPLHITAQDTKKPVTLSLSANVMVCHEICVPQFFDLSLKIPAGKAEASRNAPLLKAAQDKIPHKGALPTLSINSVIAGPDALVINTTSHRGYDDFDLFIETPEDAPMLLSAPDVSIEADGDQRNAMIRIAKPEDVENLAAELMNKDITITVTAHGTAIEQDFSL